MQPVIPAELMHSTAQLLVYFVTIVAGLVSFMWSTRAF